MANTQTTVPLFVANAVLTAAQQNISAGTGVPVFATTVTRDAAFGGSNKALAEGQLCYIEASNVVQYYDSTAWATVGPTASKIAQVVSATFNTETSTTSTTFVTTGLNASITPTLNTSKILIVATTFGYQVTASPIALFTLFRGTVAGTNLATGATPFMSGAYSGGGDLQFAVACQFVDSPATTSATTYTLGFRASSVSTVTAQKSTAQASITLMEILA